MIREAATVPAGARVERDVCVVGAGAAGIALALELARRGRSVCLLESGGEALQSANQDLYRGAAPSGGLIRSEDYLWASRVRFLGGSTNHWDGECERLDPGDFAPRPWVPHSGWPISPETLTPWYGRAAELLEIREEVADGPPFEAEGLVRTPALTSPPTRFGTRYRDELAGSERIQLLLRANAVALTPNESASALSGVEVATQAGARFGVHAERYVLATGALENARLLLASRGALGNRHDRVGRYFMDPLYGTNAAHLLLLRPLPAPAVLRLSEAVQREHGLLGTRFRLRPLAPRPTGLPRQLAGLAEDVARAAAPSPRTGTSASFAAADIGIEVAPDPANRVTLGDELDPLGVPRLALHAAPGELERASIAGALELFAARLGATLEARVQLAEDLWSGLEPGMHPSGTTRMHDDPRQGVVDPDCRVHGVANLYVAGSSVFPTCGRARPTWALLALALRLADHLGGLAS